MPPAPGAKHYSLFQRFVRVVQTNIRRFDYWAGDRVMGLPNTPELELKRRTPKYADLWEFTLADHRRIAGEVWDEYWASLDGPSEEEMERTKEEVKQAARTFRGDVESTAGKNLSFIDEKLEGTTAKENLRVLGAQSSENVAYLKKELKHVAEGVDTDAVLAHARQVVEENRSKDDVATTLKKNVGELRDLAKSGRDAALRVERKDLDRVKVEAQSWLADKLLVGQSVLMAFLEGYREGKTLELEREDALLITFAKQAAEDHKDIIQEQLTKILDDQREKQRREQAEEAANEKAEKGDSGETTAAAEPSSSTPGEPIKATDERTSKLDTTGDQQKQR
ncbi:hypothetical protein BBJ28_00011957 [Nothophytophthora sp. Chile5]|nr:hypothetical protein BBJ28_00011957 [Nothophytophthora sp. Chile5]